MYTTICHCKHITVFPPLHTQAVNGGVGPVDLTLEPQGPTYRLPQSIPVAVLRNHKRAFMRIATQVLGGRVENEAAVKKMFVEYLAERCR